MCSEDAMTDEKGYVRTNISLPRALKGRMDAVDASVNWSQVAASAFEVHLRRLESEKEGSAMDDVIARMKAADELDCNEQHQEGLDAGRKWVTRAKGHATPRQLRTLAKAIERQDVRDLVETYASGLNSGVMRGLYSELHPREERPDELDVTAFWDNVLQDPRQIEDVAFAVGFIEGAMEEWEKIESHI